MAKTFVDGNDTAVAWALNETGLAVWPIGAWEQHGRHLPVATDTIWASYFGEQVAAALGAVLLPTLPFGTSLEHAGFRGTITLTPELLMAVVKQVADELEGQNFTRLVLLSGHGGNFSIYPAVRWINRQDRKLKILVLCVGDHMRRVWGQRLNELHSGEMETSMMLALHPELVTPDRCDGGPPVTHEPFEQADLNTFGVGRVNPEGTWGWPSRGNAADGRQALDAVVVSMVEWVRKRLTWLAEDPRYGGPGRPVLRPLRASDIPLGMRLKQAAGWSQNEDDWRMMLDLGADGTFAAVLNGVAVGTVSTITYEGVCSWIGMVLVDPAYRRRGIGRTLLSGAIAAARPHGAVRLDATPAGRELYLTLGFVDEYPLARWEIAAAPTPPPGPSPCRPLTSDDLPAVAAWDAPRFGAPRGAVLRALFARAPHCAFAVGHGDQLRGYCLARPRAGCVQLGPLLATDDETAQALFTAALRAVGGQSLILDVPDAHTAFRARLTALGFEIQRPFMRMALGATGPLGQPSCSFAIAGAELG